MMNKWEPRFWAKVDKTNSCWMWTGCRKQNGGYGSFGLNGKTKRTHILSWELVNGPVPPGHCVAHKCDTPPCVNPDHLFLATHAENMADMRDKKRQAYGARNKFAKLTDEQVIAIRADRRSYKEIALTHGITPNLVCCVTIGKSWKHIAVTHDPRRHQIIQKALDRFAGTIQKFGALQHLLGIRDCALANALRTRSKRGRAQRVQRGLWRIG